MKFIIDLFMECLLLFLRLLMTSRLKRILVYFFQFMSRFESGGDMEKGVLKSSIIIFQSEG